MPFHLPSLFKTPVHRTFALKTRYYDKRKDDLNRRIQSIQSEGTDGVYSAENSKTRMRYSFREHRLKRAQSSRSGNLRFILILMILLSLTYLFFR